jgi:hypothetical protein
MERINTMDFREADIEVTDQAFTPVVKNTFITLEDPFAFTMRRSQSDPTLHIHGSEYDSASKADVQATNARSDSSTDACTEYSDDEFEGSVEARPTSESVYSFFTEMSSTTSFSQSSWQGCCEDTFYSTQPVQSSFQPVAVEPPPTPTIARLSSKATAFMPKECAQETSMDQYKMHFVRVLHSVARYLKKSELVVNVDISEDPKDCSIVLQVNGEEGDYLIERAVTLAKEALLDAASHSKCIYVMGYSSPKPFEIRAQGFQCTLGAMENAKEACWHVFKKGYCRHEGNCCKQHPGCSVPVRVLIETVEFNAPIPVVNDFKLQVADLVLTLTSSLKNSPHSGQVSAWKSPASKCWTIEMATQDDCGVYKDYLLTLAKNALYSATSESKSIYIMGYNAEPFFSKPEGFVAMLADMQNESRACWDYYTTGVCHRDCACRWEHPTCLMPINVVVKPLQSDA